MGELRLKVNFRKRIKEINFYINQIPDEIPSTKNREHIDSYTRVSTILLCSHFEGALKDIIEAFIKEVNQLNIKCNNLDTRLYTKNLFSNPDSKLKDINSLINVLDNYKIALNEESIISLDHKYFNNTESNPKPEIIIKLFRIFGYDNIIDLLNAEIKGIPPKYEQSTFFSNFEKEQLRKFLSDRTIKRINNILEKSRPNNKQLYKYGFYKNINDLLLARNRIVHGDSNFKLTKPEVIELKREIFKLLCGLNKKLNANLAKMKQK